MQIFLNPSPFNTELHQCDMSKISCFLLNEIEGEQFAGTSNPEEILSAMLEMYPKAQIVLTLGRNGSIYGDQNNRYVQSVHPVEVVDTTAAGDTFTGYFIAGIIKGMRIERILKMCAVAAGLAVSRKGASPSIPYLEEVEMILK